MVKGADQTTDLNVGDPEYSITGGNLKDCEIWFANDNNNAANNILLNAWNATDQSKTLGRFVIEYSVSKPWMYILVSGKYDNNWTQVDRYLWGNGDASITYPIMDETYKSIFDPSPEGYRVAPADLWANFTMSNTNAKSSATGAALELFKTENFNVVSVAYSNTNKANGYGFYYQGWKSGDVDFYLTSGYRTRGSGSLCGDVGSEGNLWASRCVELNSASLHITASSVMNRNTAARALGYPVRCVKER